MIFSCKKEKKKKKKKKKKRKKKKKKKKNSYLLKREEPPYCIGCDTLFTVRHFLLECDDFSHIRNKYFHVDTIKQLFNDVPIDNVFLFLKEINLLNKL